VSRARLRSLTLSVLVVGGLGCAARTEQQATLERAGALLSQQEKRRGDVLFRCEPEDAEVVLDGVPQGTCQDFDGEPHGLRIGEGMHRLEVRKPGFLPYETYYEPNGARAVIRVKLKPRAGQEGARS
jgi:hypothetical protein